MKYTVTQIIISLYQQQKTILTRNKRFAGFISSRVVTQGWRGKTAGGIVFALIFFVTFLYQDKKVNRHYEELKTYKVQKWPLFK